MKKPEVPANVLAEARKQALDELESEGKKIAKPIMARTLRWVQTAAWWKLVLAIIATWPLSIFEAAIMHEIIGFFPGMGTLVDGVIFHVVNEWIFLWFPIALFTELFRRFVGAVRSVIATWFPDEDPNP